ncbi:hypothetical protein BC937DRAFT_93526 [Endogone sp. FLAS-F59071]|nr:hypothetical protein BC937DRAFT_93526 [Endogone sp. FLAS-F59071]|eukprot:RUS21139.1 hypothetical protein BC937DRAFT_93526 [Endogone sp. FLAS-F59071]
MPKSKPKPRAAKLKDSLAKLLSEHSRHKKKLQSQGVSQTRKSNPTKSPSKPFCSPYTATDRILLVGEGNFSFARALAEHVLGRGENLVATCLDSEEVLILKYEDEARANVEAVVAAGGTVLYEVDATKLNKCAALKGKRFEKIVFNFPHAGAGIKDQDRNVISNQTLLLSFFASSIPFLASPVAYPTTDSAHGELHVTLKSGAPYDLWNVRQLVKQTGSLAVKTTLPFVPEAYPGYEHRRTLGFKDGTSKAGNEEIEGKSPKTYVFVREEAVKGELEKVREGMERSKKEKRVARAGGKRKKRGEEDEEEESE